MQWCFSQVKGAIDDDVAEGMCYYLHFISLINLTHWWLTGLFPWSFCL